MQYTGVLLAVKDIARAKEFYMGLLGCEVGMDLGMHVSFRNGISLQQEDSWFKLTRLAMGSIQYGANDAELYFEEHSLDAFVAKLQTFGVQIIHPIQEHSWGQRVIRFYDPDLHIIEVGEQMGDVTRRFLDAGMSRGEAARRMDVPLEMIAVFLGE